MQSAGWLLMSILLLQLSKSKASQCCQNKVADGVNYQLVSSTDPAPSFCLGGCIYTKENDPKPGTNYCFREGDDIVSCSGGDCGSTENWIKQFFNEECSAKVNSYLGVNVEEVPVLSNAQCGPAPLILGADISLFDNPNCQGMRVQNTSTRPSEVGPYSTADFFLRTENALPWSVLAIKEGYQTTCQPIGVIKPFIENLKTIYMLKDENNYNDIAPYMFLNFRFNISNQLLPDVFIQGNPGTCSRSYQPAPGPNPSGPPPGAGKCSPTCTYAAWNTDPRKTSCPCRGMIGGGMKFVQWSVPNLQDPNGKSTMIGSLIAYQELRYPKNNLWFADFQRRNSESIKVCESNLEVTTETQLFPVKISKKVPCFAAQIPPTAINSTVGAGDPAQTTTEELVSMFSEVDGALVWGGGDRFWLIACQMVEIDFFTALDPKETPEFCGCIISDYFPWQSGVATKDQIKRCYVQAIQDGPAPGFGPTKLNRFSMWNKNTTLTM